MKKLEDEFIYGQEYEFSNYSDFKKQKKEILIYDPKDGFFASWDGIKANTWKYCRKINTEKTEAIKKAVELINESNGK